MDVTDKKKIAKKVAKYVLLPEVFPRMGALFASGFSHIAFNMALVYQSVGLLPIGHPYSHSANRERFGISHVIAEASRRLVFRWRNIDQIIMFFALLLGIVFLFLQFILMGTGIFIHAAHALPIGFPGFFETTAPTHDIAFVLLDRVFGLGGAGVPTLFNSCVAQMVPCFVGVGSGDSLSTTTGAPVIDIFPTPFHLALRAVMQLYSVGIMVIALLIFMYFIVAVITETAQTGTPFGKRFNHVWAPIRVVVALGLLIPIAQGLNSAQYIALYAAKWGSGLGTNGWILYVNEAITAGTQLGPTNRLIANPKPLPQSTLTKFMTIVSTCAMSEKIIHNRDIRAYFVRNPAEAPPNMAIGGVSYIDALTFYHFGDVLIRFGELSPTKYPDEAGYVKPVCGDVVVQTTTLNQAGSPGAWELQEHYYQLILDFWNFMTACAVDPWGGGFPLGLSTFCGIAHAVSAHNIPIYPNPPASPLPPLPGVDNLTLMSTVWEDTVLIWIADAVIAQQASPVWVDDLTALGWAGAGIWYNKIAQLNGELFTAAANVPYVKRYPIVMEYVAKAHLQHDAVFNSAKRFRPYLSDEDEIDWKLPGDEILAETMYHTYTLWSAIEPKAKTNVIRDIINMIFGTSGLFDLVTNESQNIHPLAQLAGIGKSLVESSVRNIGFSFLAFGGGGLAGILGRHEVASVGMAASDMASSVAMIGLGAGFILYYIIPFLPFIYFFFAVGAWIKGIFEAMVGMPLWALAHIRIDGEGLPGDAALNGYFLLLEIFIRPLLIIFGLIAALVIFAAQIRVLHDIWPMVVHNVGGSDELAPPGPIEYLRGEVDTFFYTIIYAIIVYMTGMASFKLIDLIPNHILRWIGQTVPTFAEQSDNPEESLTRYTLMGTQMIGGNLRQVTRGGQDAARSFSQAANPPPG